MDESDSDHNQNEESSSSTSRLEDGSKRFKPSDLLEENSNASELVTPEKTAGRSTEVQSGSGDQPEAPTFKPSPQTRNRNYRNSQRSNDDDSGDQEDRMSESAPQQMEEEAEDDDNEWEDFEDDDDDAEGSSGEDLNLFSDSSDDSTVVIDENDANMDDHPLFKKEKPKHWWSALQEVNKRQLGYSANLQSCELFQRKCYGSLHCVTRLELMYKMEDHGGCVNSLNFHPDGSLLVSGADDLKLIVWDWKLGKSLMEYKTKHRGNVFQSKFLHLTGDLHIASCARDGQVRLAQLSREEGVRNARLLGSHKGPCHKLIVLPEQPHIILSAGEDGAVISHDVRGPKSTKVITVKEDSKTVALYSIHGHPLKTHEFCVSGRDSFVRVYDQRKSNKLVTKYTPFVKVKPSFRNHVTCAVYNHIGSEILASYSDDDIYLFDVNNSEPGKFIHRYEGHRNGATIKGVNFFGPKSEFVVSGSDCGYIYFWERNTEALVQWFAGDDSGVVNCLEPHPQLPFICTSGLDWDVKVWVPSCEDEPKMEGLKKTLRNNGKQKLNNLDAGDINESQMLWMLWRHLRNTRRLRATLNVRGLLEGYSNSNSSGSDSVSNDDDSEEEIDAAPNCNPS